MTRRKSHQKGHLQWHRNCWTLRYWELNHQTGKWKLRREKLDGFDDLNKKKPARQAADNLIAKVNERNNNPKRLKASGAESEITFKQFAEGRWKAYTVSARHQPSTIDHRNSLLKNYLLPFFGEKKVREITRSDVSDFFETLQGKATNTLQNIYGLLRSMFVVACEHGLRKKSPVRSKIHRPETERIEKPVLNAVQIRAILAGLPDEQERLFALLIAVTGMRMGEALALRRMDFDAVACELSINHTLYRMQLKKPKTEKSRRKLRLAPSIARLLLSHAKGSAFQAPDDLIFCRADGRPLNPSALRRHLYQSMDKSGIKRVKSQYGYHILRHSAGTLVYLKSRDLKLVQATLGHADISTTSDIYVHLNDKVLEEGAEILAKEILENCDPVVTQASEMVS